MAVEIITKEDLFQFKIELLKEISKTLKPSDSVDHKNWLKSSEVRKLLKISPGTLQNLRINGTLHYTKLGGIIYYKMSDINNLLEGEKNA